MSVQLRFLGSSFGARLMVKLAPKATLEPAVVIHGVFKPQRFRDFLQHFIIFEEGADFGVLHKLSRALLDGAHA